MTFREALPGDISAMHRIRVAVKENVLSNPSLVTEADYAEYLGGRGRAWVCENGVAIVGFAIVDLKANNVWALFVHAEWEGQGIGTQLHERMMEWYFSQTADAIWLSTAPGTRAAGFYAAQGWRETGPHGKKEIRFEMSAEDWSRRCALPA